MILNLIIDVVSIVVVVGDKISKVFKREES